MLRPTDSSQNRVKRPVVGSDPPLSLSTNQGDRDNPLILLPSLESEQKQSPSPAMVPLKSPVVKVRQDVPTSSHSSPLSVSPSFSSSKVEHVKLIVSRPSQVVRPPLPSSSLSPALSSPSPDGRKPIGREGKNRLYPNGEFSLSSLASVYTASLYTGDVVGRSKDRWKNKREKGTNSEDSVLAREHQKVQAAIRIQSLWRKYASRKKFLLLLQERAIRNVQRAISSLQIRYKLYRRRRERWRKKVATEFLQEIPLLLIVRAVERVQRWYRWERTKRRIERRFCHSLSIRVIDRVLIPLIHSTKESLLSLRDTSARKIQSLFRRYHRKVRALELGRNRRQQRSAETIQRSFRCYVARKEYRKRKRNKACVSIQLQFRAYIAREVRERLARERESRRYVSRITSLAIERESVRFFDRRVRLLQRVYRGMKGREIARRKRLYTDEQKRREDVSLPLFAYEVGDYRRAAVLLSLALQAGAKFSPELWGKFAFSLYSTWEVSGELSVLRLACSAYKQSLEYEENCREDAFLKCIYLLEKNGELKENVKMIARFIDRYAATSERLALLFRRACYLRELSRYQEAIAGLRDIMGACYPSSSSSPASPRTQSSVAPGSVSPTIPYTEDDFRLMIASTFEKWGKGEETEKMNEANLIYEQLYLERELHTDTGPYFGEISQDQAAALIEGKPVGSFLVFSKEENRVDDASLQLIVRVRKTEDSFADVDFKRTTQGFYEYKRTHLRTTSMLELLRRLPLSFGLDISLPVLKRRAEKEDSGDGAGEYFLSWQEWILSPVLWEKLGLKCFSHNDFYLARDFLQQATLLSSASHSSSLSFSSSNAGHYEKIALCYRETNRNVDAVVWLQKAIKAASSQSDPSSAPTPKSPNISSSLSVLAAQRKFWASAGSPFDEEVRKNHFYHRLLTRAYKYGRWPREGGQKSGERDKRKKDWKKMAAILEFVKRKGSYFGDSSFFQLLGKSHFYQWRDEGDPANLKGAIEALELSLQFPACSISPSSVYLLALCYHASQKYVMSNKLGARLLKEFPGWKKPPKREEGGRKAVLFLIIQNSLELDNYGKCVRYARKLLREVIDDEKTGSIRTDKRKDRREREEQLSSEDVLQILAMIYSAWAEHLTYTLGKRQEARQRERQLPAALLLTNSAPSATPERHGENTGPDLSVKPETKRANPSAERKEESPTAAISPSLLIAKTGVDTAERIVTEGPAKVMTLLKTEPQRQEESSPNPQEGPPSNSSADQLLASTSLLPSSEPLPLVAPTPVRTLPPKGPPPKPFPPAGPPPPLALSSPKKKKGKKKKKKTGGEGRQQADEEVARVESTTTKKKKISKKKEKMANGERKVGSEEEKLAQNDPIVNAKQEQSVDQSKSVLLSPAAAVEGDKIAPTETNGLCSEAVPSSSLPRSPTRPGASSTETPAQREIPSLSESFLKEWDEAEERVIRRRVQEYRRKARELFYLALLPPALNKEKEAKQREDEDSLSSQPPPHRLNVRIIRCSRLPVPLHRLHVAPYAEVLCHGQSFRTAALGNGALGLSRAIQSSLRQRALPFLRAFSSPMTTSYPASGPRLFSSSSGHLSAKDPFWGQGSKVYQLALSAGEKFTINIRDEFSRDAKVIGRLQLSPSELPFNGNRKWRGVQTLHLDDNWQWDVKQSTIELELELVQEERETSHMPGTRGETEMRHRQIKDLLTLFQKERGGLAASLSSTYTWTALIRKCLAQRYYALAVSLSRTAQRFIGWSYEVALLLATALREGGKEKEAERELEETLKECFKQQIPNKEVMALRYQWDSPPAFSFERDVEEGLFCSPWVRFKDPADQNKFFFFNLASDEIAHSPPAIASSSSAASLQSFEDEEMSPADVEAVTAARALDMMKSLKPGLKARVEQCKKVADSAHSLDPLKWVEVYDESASQFHFISKETGEKSLSVPPTYVMVGDYGKIQATITIQMAYRRRIARRKAHQDMKKKKGVSLLRSRAAGMAGERAAQSQQQAEQEEKERLQSLSCLFVRLFSANNVRSKEEKLRPFIEMTLGDESWKTRVAKESSSPEWNEVFGFPCTWEKNKDEKLSLTLYNFNYLQSAELGKVLIPLLSFDHGRVVRGLYTLQGDGVSEGGEKMAVDLEIQWVDKESLPPATVWLLAREEERRREEAEWIILPPDPPLPIPELEIPPYEPLPFPSLTSQNLNQLETVYRMGTNSVSQIKHIGEIVSQLNRIGTQLEKALSRKDVEIVERESSKIVTVLLQNHGPEQKKLDKQVALVRQAVKIFERAIIPVFIQFKEEKKRHREEWERMVERKKEEHADIVKKIVEINEIRVQPKRVKRASRKTSTPLQLAKGRGSQRRLQIEEENRDSGADEELQRIPSSAENPITLDETSSVHCADEQSHEEESPQLDDGKPPIHSSLVSPGEEKTLKTEALDLMQEGTSHRRIFEDGASLLPPTSSASCVTPVSSPPAANSSSSPTNPRSVDNVEVTTSVPPGKRKWRVLKQGIKALGARALSIGIRQPFELSQLKPQNLLELLVIKRAELADYRRLLDDVHKKTKMILMRYQGNEKAEKMLEGFSSSLKVLEDSSLGEYKPSALQPSDLRAKRKEIQKRQGQATELIVGSKVEEGEKVEVGVALLGDSLEKTAAVERPKVEIEGPERGETTDKARNRDRGDEGGQLSEGSPRGKPSSTIAAEQGEATISVPRTEAVEVHRKTTGIKTKRRDQRHSDDAHSNTANHRKAPRRKQVEKR